MTDIDEARRLLLISNSTLHGSGYFDHAEKEIRDFVGRRITVLFVPYAVHDRRAAAAAFLYEKAQRHESGVRLNFAA
jgi:peptidase E